MTTFAAAFDGTDPAAFYLPEDGRADMEALVDATLVVEQGCHLPAHRSVVGLQSRVLRGLFADLAGGDEAGVGSKRKADSQEALVLEAPFQDCTLFDACLFLRCCYQPRDLTPANLATVLGSLPGLLRLAHKLNALQIEQAVCECMADKVRFATQSDLLDWAAAADRCQLPELRLRCLSELARRLASGPGSLAKAFADAELLAERCDRSVLAHLLVLLATAGGTHVPGGLPAPDAAAAALQESSNHGSFEWALERYSQRPSAVRQSVHSPWFSAAGKEWRLQLFPGGDSSEAAEHLSVYLHCKQGGTRAKFGITLVDQSGAQHISCNSEPIVLEPARGWSKFATHDRLRSRPGYLAGERLVLRARVEVVP